MQFTVRGVPTDVERAARERARRDGLSINQVLIKALRQGLGVEVLPEKKRDLSALFGRGLITPEVEAALEALRQIDPELWDAPPDTKAEDAKTVEAS